MTDKERAEQISAINKLTKEESEEKFSQLNNIKQVDLTEIEKVQYLILKWNVEGKEAFFEDSYIAILLQELILLWIDEKRDIPDIFVTYFLMTHINWLIDWNNSSESLVIVRQDIVDNMHTFINPFLEEIEEILGERYKSRESYNIKERIIYDIESLVNYHEKDKLPLIYNALFKMKYALQGAREYMVSDYTKSICVNSQIYELDVQSIAHIFLRHTNRFKSLSHRDNRGKRGFMNNELGKEYAELDKLLKAIEASASVKSNGVITCLVEGENYKMIINTDRIITLYPMV